jgi:hypothetical protein
MPNNRFNRHQQLRVIKETILGNLSSEELYGISALLLVQYARPDLVAPILKQQQDWTLLALVEIYTKGYTINAWNCINKALTSDKDIQIQTSIYLECLPQETQQPEKIKQILDQLDHLLFKSEYYASWIV